MNDDQRKLALTHLVVNSSFLIFSSSMKIIVEIGY